MTDLLGVFGGTFDPVHFGHLRVALEAALALDCHDMRLMPARMPPHRDRPQATAEHRLEMLEMALKNQQRLSVDPRELDRQGPSYTVDTLLGLRAQARDRPVALVLGEDVYAGFNRWHKWERLLDLAHVVVLARPGAPRRFHPQLEELLDRRSAQNAAELSARAAGSMLRLPTTALGISASRIRELIRGGGSARYLLPDEVLEFIRDHRLYRGAGKPDDS